MDSFDAHIGLRVSLMLMMLMMCWMLGTVPWRETPKKIMMIPMIIPKIIRKGKVEL